MPQTTQTAKPLFPLATQTAVSSPEKTLTPQMEMAIRQGQLNPTELNPAEYDRHSAALIMQLIGERLYGRDSIAPQVEAPMANIPPATRSIFQPQELPTSGLANAQSSTHGWGYQTAPVSSMLPNSPGLNPNLPLQPSVPPQTREAVGASPAPVQTAQPQAPIVSEPQNVPPSPLQPRPVATPSPQPLQSRPVTPIEPPAAAPPVATSQPQDPDGPEYIESPTYSTAPSPGSGVVIEVPGIGDIELSPQWLERSGGMESPMVQRWQSNPSEILAGLEEGKYQIKNGRFGWSDDYLNRFPDLQQYSMFGSLVSTSGTPVGKLPGSPGISPPGGAPTEEDSLEEELSEETPAAEDATGLLTKIEQHKADPTTYSLEELIADWQEVIKEEQKKYPDVAGMPVHYSQMTELIPELGAFRDRFESDYGTDNYGQLSDMLADFNADSFIQQVKNAITGTGTSTITHRPSRTIERRPASATLERVFGKATADRIMRLTGEGADKPSGDISERFRSDRSASGGYKAPERLRPPRSAAAGTPFAQPGTMRVNLNEGAANQPPLYATPTRSQLNQNLRKRLELYR